jgi:ATP-dependent helicase/DNAse subunit B
MANTVWVSHTSISDYLKCPRAYFLKNVYKDPKTGHKIKLMSPPLALGQAVHEVLESLSVLPAKNRFKNSLVDKYNQIWAKVSGKNGGFYDSSSEYESKARGEAMIRRVEKSPGVLQNPAVKIGMDLPKFTLSETDNIILCGKIDWLEYLPDTDSVHIIDFKTSKGKEDTDSLQLPIYTLLVANCQNRTTTKASYWYLDQSNDLEEKPLPDLEESKTKVLRIARQIKLARQFEKYTCPHDGCFACKPYESIIKGNAEYVGVDGYNYDVYILPQKLDHQIPESIIL